MTENLPDTKVRNIKYINKQDAVDALEAKKDKSANGDIGCFYNTIIQNTIDALNGLPSADVVKVRHAKDVYKQYNKHHCEFMCSLCGGWIGVIEGGDCDFNYCPNCGAKMVE